MPILEVRGPRLTFKRFAEASITPEYLAWLNDKTLLQYSRQRLHAHTYETARAYLRSFESGGGFLWSIERTADATPIGTLSVHCDEIGVGEFGPLIGAAAARGLGFGREASGMAIAFLFDVVRARRVTAGASEPNVAMNRCCRHWGMTLEGVLREQESIGSNPIIPVNGHFYGILRAEWEALPHRVRVETHSD